MLLEDVKNRLSIEGTESDAVISGYIDDVIAFCGAAGVPNDIMQKEAGIVARGVSDLWEGKNGFSEIFRMRLLQLQASVKKEQA